MGFNFLAKFFRRSQTATLAKVVVFGANSTVGQPLSFLLKMCPHVGELVCCSTPSDRLVSPAGVAVDLSHIDTSAIVRYALNEDDWQAALREAHLVLVCPGSNFDPSRDDRDAVLSTTAPAVISVMQAIARAPCRPVVGIISSPLNALLPLCAAIMKHNGNFDPRKLMGVTALDVVRTRKHVAEAHGMNPFDVNIPVVGGRGGITACPLITQTGLGLNLDSVVSITNEIQSYGASNVVASEADDPSGDTLAIEGAPSVSLSLAYASFEWSVSVLKALRGDRGITECTMVESTMRGETPFFSSRVELGLEGVERLLPMGKLTPYENELVEAAIPKLVDDMQAGLRYLGERQTLSTSG